MTDELALVLLLPRAEVETLRNIRNLLEQIIDMNGEEWFWRHMASMPVTKFNSALRLMLEADKKETTEEAEK